MKENCFSSSWKEKNELEKRQILYYVVAVGPHTSSLFFLTNICHQILFFSEHLVNPLLLLVLTARMYYVVLIGTLLECTVPKNFFRVFFHICVELCCTLFFNNSLKS